MKLDKWMERYDHTDESAATVLGCDRSTVTRLRTEARNASLALALGIEASTGGEVRAEELPLTEETRAALRLSRQSSRGAA